MAFLIPFAAGAIGLGSSALVTGGVATAATAAAASAGATFGTAALVGGIAYTGIKSAQAQSALSKTMAQPLTSPNAPQNYSAIAAQETSNALRRSQARTKTILTNPLGVSDSGANVQRKTLLGT